MPIFEYRCKDCGTKFEELVPSSDSTVICPKCKSENTDKLLSMFAASCGSSGASGSGGGSCSSGFS